MSGQRARPECPLWGRRALIRSPTSARPQGYCALADAGLSKIHRTRVNGNLRAERVLAHDVETYKGICQPYRFDVEQGRICVAAPERSTHLDKVSGANGRPTSICAGSGTALLVLAYLDYSEAVRRFLDVPTLFIVAAPRFPPFAMQCVNHRGSRRRDLLSVKRMWSA